YSSLICCQVVIFRSFQGFPQQLQPLALSISRQREANSTALHAAVNTSSSTSFWLRWPEATCCRKLRNSLFTKEFSVSTAPEVGRIIDI
ncbi:hypothetical protein, partial [Pseudomonas reinekei]|uniref:hypothetical protein n=1 Tax=Pseudomonas reinekei TaxID=395598 RepID=UPI001ABFEDC3